MNKGSRLINCSHHTFGTRQTFCIPESEVPGVMHSLIYLLLRYGISAPNEASVVLVIRRQGRRLCGLKSDLLILQEIMTWQHLTVKVNYTPPVGQPPAIIGRNNRGNES
jgi:hypothetical protein